MRSCRVDSKLLKISGKDNICRTKIMNVLWKLWVFIFENGRNCANFAKIKAKNGRMGRILAIDFGRKRTGIAVTDPLKIVANGLATIPTHTLIDFVQDYVKREAVERIVIGLPKRLDNTPSESMKYLEPFLNRLKKVLPDMPITMYDERFTSTLAHKAMIDGGMKKSDRRNKAVVDTIAAAIILNDFLQSSQI